MSATSGGPDGTVTQNAGERLGFTTGMVVQELGWDDDVDDAVRVSVEDVIDGDMVDGDYATSSRRSCSGGATTTATWLTPWSTP